MAEPYELEAMQMATQAAISKAFQTPEVIKMFALKQPEQLRQRLTVIQRDSKLGKLSAEAYQREAMEILTALKKLGAELSDEEKTFMQSNMTAGLANFEKVEGDN